MAGLHLTGIAQLAWQAQCQTAGDCMSAMTDILPNNCRLSNGTLWFACRPNDEINKSIMTKSVMLIATPGCTVSIS